MCRSVSTNYYSQYIGHCLENYVVYFGEYVTVYCLLFQVYVDAISIHFNSVKQMGMNECKVNRLQYSGRQFISEFTKYAQT